MACSDRTRGNCFKPKENRFRLDIDWYGGKTQEEVARQSCGCPIIGSVQSQIGQGFEQPDLLNDVPAHGSGDGLDDL